MRDSQLNPGMRVRLRSASHLLKLKTSTGTVVRPGEWLDSYIVRLDEPAIYCNPDGSTEELTEIREGLDNLDVLAADQAIA